MILFDGPYATPCDAWRSENMVLSFVHPSFCSPCNFSNNSRSFTYSLSCNANIHCFQESLSQCFEQPGGFSFGRSCKEKPNMNRWLLLVSPDSRRCFSSAINAKSLRLRSQSSSFGDWETLGLQTNGFHTRLLDQPSSNFKLYSLYISIKRIPQPHGPDKQTAHFRNEWP